MGQSSHKSPSCIISQFQTPQHLTPRPIIFLLPDTSFSLPRPYIFPTPRPHIFPTPRPHIFPTTKPPIFTLQVSHVPHTHRPYTFPLQNPTPLPLPCRTMPTLAPSQHCGRNEHRPIYSAGYISCNELYNVLDTQKQHMLGLIVNF